MEKSLMFILEELSLKYVIPLTIYDGKKIFNFPPDKNCTSELQDSLITHSLNFNTVDYFHVDRQVFASFDCNYKNKETLAVLIGPYPIENLIDLKSSSDSLNSNAILNSNIIKRREFITFVSVIHNLLKNSPLPPIADWLSSTESLHEIYQLSKLNIDSRRLSNTFEDSVELEKRFLDAVHHNEHNKIEWIISKAKSTFPSQISLKTLENVKYKCVGIITLITRLSINRGISSVRAYSLSDSLIRTLDKIENITDCLQFMKEGAFLFMELIHHSPYTQKSHLVKNILFYIDSNIYDKITIEDLTDYTSRHKTHISSQFKKEMKQTIHSYINKKKVFEAKHLLILTDQSYKEISSLLNFSSQSHFNHIFKKIEGISPAEYRLKNNLNYDIL